MKKGQSEQEAEQGRTKSKQGPHANQQKAQARKPARLLEQEKVKASNGQSEQCAQHVEPARLLEEAKVKAGSSQSEQGPERTSRRTRAQDYTPQQGSEQARARESYKERRAVGGHRERETGKRRKSETAEHCRTLDDSSMLGKACLSGTRLSTHQAPCFCTV